MTAPGSSEPEAGGRKAAKVFLESVREFVPYVIVERDGDLLVVPTDDPSLRRLFVQGGRSEETLLATALACLTEAGVDVSRSTLVDVGANVGTMVLAALRAGFASVVACEPVARTFRLLRATLALNGVEDSVRTLDVALSNSAGTAVVDLERGSGKARVLAQSEHVTTEGSEEIRMTTLDDLAADGAIDPAEVGVLVIDAEGHEVHVLQGARSVLERGVPLIMELNPKLMRLGGKIDDLPDLLARHYTHVADLRPSDIPASLRPNNPALLPVDRLGPLIEHYKSGCTDILACCLPTAR